MAINSNPQAISWANNKVRVLADLMYTVYTTCKDFKTLADAQQIYGAANPIPNDATFLDDGSAPTGSGTSKTPDGRPPMTDAQATNLYNRAVDLINYFEGSATVTTNDNSKGILNTVTNVQVNGQPKF